MNTRRLLSPFLSILLSLLILTASPAPASAASPDPLQGIDAVILKAMADWNVPGLAVAVVKDDQVIMSRGYGVIEAGKPARVDEKTIFAIGSATKAFTAASAAVLVDDGKMAWDAPAQQYLPSFQLFDPWVTRHFTVRDALTHRSGLDRTDAMWYYWGYDSNELLRRLRYVEPSWEFRAKFGYQNLMYLAAGKMVEAASGETWGDFLKTRIFTPLGMTATSTSTAALQGQPDVATPHVNVKGQITAISYRNIDNVAPAGAINSNVVDMAQWIRLQLNDGKVGDKQLISAKSMQEMHAAQMVVAGEPTWNLVYSYSPFLSYGLGWFLSDYNGHPIADHGGNIDGMSALVSLMPRDKLGVVILTNLNETLLPSPLALEIYDRLLGRPASDWSAKYKAGFDTFMRATGAQTSQIESAHIAGTKPTLPLKSYAGDYYNAAYGTIKVTEQDGVLSIQAGVMAASLEHWQYDTFTTISTGASAALLPPIFLTFELNAQGQVDTLNIPTIGRFARPTSPTP
jgi:CubicO group peptidase (beta-lactamase class C family)